MPKIGISCGWWHVGVDIFLKRFIEKEVFPPRYTRRVVYTCFYHTAPIVTHLVYVAGGLISTIMRLCLPSQHRFASVARSFILTMMQQHRFLPRVALSSPGLLFAEQSKLFWWLHQHNGVHAPACFRWSISFSFACAIYSSSIIVM